MKKFTKAALAFSAALAVTAVNATPAQNQKHAEGVTKTRKALYTLVVSNMGPLGAMAKGKIPVDAKQVEKYATRLEQLSLMMPDYTRVDTSKFDVKTEALPKVWTEKALFAEKIDALQKASVNLKMVAKGGNAGDIKKAIGGVGKTCKGCHDEFKAD